MSRVEIIKKILCEDIFDLVIIGGGIHGAVAAKQSASLGLKVLLLEKQDYASATSSRSSKMAHGGLRYLELFDFQQVFEGIKARDKLFEDYPDIVKPYPFYIPVYKQDRFFKFKLGVGLKLYDLFLKNKSLRHRWLAKKDVIKKISEFESHNIRGCYQYTDGVMSDFQLVIENITRARSAGAFCLNYSEVVNLDYQKAGGISSVSFNDLIGNQELRIKSKFVLNCAGPWFSDFDQSLSERAKFSRGSHLIFNRPWNQPALFLPMEGAARYYFVWPHSAGTMVGTTEVPVGELPADPLPSKQEVDEVLARLAKDLPDSGLVRENLHYVFAGIRTLPLRGDGNNLSKISRKHIWKQQDNQLSLIGGKLTTAEWTIKEGLKLVLKHLDTENKPGEMRNYTLPACLSIELAFKYQQAATLEDFMRRRSGLEYFPDAGYEFIEQHYEELAEYVGKDKIDSQIIDYKNRIQKIRVIIGN